LYTHAKSLRYLFTVVLKFFSPTTHSSILNNAAPLSKVIVSKEFTMSLGVDTLYVNGWVSSYSSQDSAFWCTFSTNDSSRSHSGLIYNNYTYITQSSEIGQIRALNPANLPRSLCNTSSNCTFPRSTTRCPTKEWSPCYRTTGVGSRVVRSWFPVFCPPFVNPLSRSRKTL